MSYGNYGGGGGYGQQGGFNPNSGFQPQGGPPPGPPGGFGPPPPGHYGGQQGGFQPQGGYGAPPPPQGGFQPQFQQNQYGQQDYGQQQQYGGGGYGQPQGQASSYYGESAPGASTGTNYGASTGGQAFSGSREVSDVSNEDLPYPWVREWDEAYKQIYYVNPTTNPPSTSWTHPSCAPGQEHPEQQQTHREAEQLYAEAGADGQQTGERGLVTNAAVGIVGYKVLSSLLNKNKHSKPPQYGGQQSSGPGWGTYAMGGAAGVGGAYLLSKLFQNKKTQKYGHQMGPPPFGGGFKY